MTEDRFALKVEKEIKSMYAIGQKATAYPVINSLANGLRNNMHMIVPTKQPEEIQKFLRGEAKLDLNTKVNLQFLQLKANEEGKFFIPLFTSTEEFEKGQKVNAIKFPFAKILEAPKNDPNFLGFVINPFGQKFFLRLDAINTLKTFMPHAVMTIAKLSVLDMNVDYIVNAANSTLMGGGGIDGEIHYHAGEKLLEECKILDGCETGQAKETKAYDIKNAEGIIHTVGPIYSGTKEDADLLAACYTNSLDLAYFKGATSIAFPCISTGVYGYPLDEAAHVAVDAITKWIRVHPGAVMNIYLCCYRAEEFEAYGKLAKEQQAKQNQQAAAKTEAGLTS